MAILKDKAYESVYSSTIDELVNKAVNREKFEYNPATDEAYKAYAKEYGRLGERAREDVLGDVANNTGGMVSSYATTAAAQAQNQYNQALTDKIPELMQIAYDRYNDEFNNNINMIGMMQGLDEAEYGRFADQRDYDRGVLESDRQYNYQIGRDAIADSQWQQQFDYQKDRDAVADKQWQDSFDYQKDRDTVADSQWQSEYDLQVRAQEYEEKFNDEQAKYEKMLTLWETTGKATKEVAKYFGVKEGATTSDYQFAAAQLALEQAKFSYQKQKDSKADAKAEEYNEKKALIEAVNKYTPSKYVTDTINRMGNYFISASPEQKKLALESIDKDTKLTEVEKEYIFKRFGLGLSLED